MTSHRSFPAVLSLLALGGVAAGCAAVPPDPMPTPAQNAQVPPSAATQEEGSGPTVREVPDIRSCDEVGAVVSAYIDGLPLEEDTSYVQPGEIGCVWATPAGTVTELTQIQRFSVDITEGMDEVPDIESAAEYGMDMYFTDPRLDEIGAVGLWMASESAPVGGGTGSVLVPGVDVTISDSRWGQPGRLTKDTLVSLSLTLLDL